MDPVPWLEGNPEGEHVYCCGPGPLMAAVKDAAAHRAADTVHFEYFSAPVDEFAEVDNKPFTIELKRSGKTFTVPENKSILEVLEENGIGGVVSSCREGTCRTCETGICSGEAEHRDYCQTPEEQASNKTMMVCVSRAKPDQEVYTITQDQVELWREASVPLYDSWAKAVTKVGVDPEQVSAEFRETLDKYGAAVK